MGAMADSSLSATEVDSGECDTRGCGDFFIEVDLSFLAAEAALENVRFCVGFSQ
jgi:hypothetical protein